MAKQFTIPVVVRTQDNGDGGYTIRAYNREDDLIADHPMARKFTDIGDGKWDYVPVELTPEQRQEILTEDDPYENGYISHERVTIEIDDAGNARLVNKLTFHAGQ